jgi:hypothetical protein
MESQTLSFGQRHFGNVDLGDERRNRRLPLLVDEMIRHPGGSLPEKLPRPADQEAFYRLCDADDVTHAAVLGAHRARTLQRLQATPGFLLVLHDTTELDYSTRETLVNLGQIGDGNGRGYEVQNSLVVDPEEGEVIGLANQVLHTRADVPENEGVAAKRDRESRESRLWLQGTQDLPARRQVVDVCDRGADTFEFLEHEFNSQRTFVVRSKSNRSIHIGHDGAGDRTLLHDYARTLPAQISNVEVGIKYPPQVLQQMRAARAGKKARKSMRPGKRNRKSPAITTSRVARLCVSAAPVQVVSPHVRRGNHGRGLLSLWIVHIWEPSPPEGCQPLEWFLLTNHPIKTVKEALRVKAWYEWRWAIEEYHKAQKTGCAIERLQQHAESRLEPAIAILSIVALLLLQLRDAARRPDADRRRASELLDAQYITILSVWLHHQPRPNWTIHQFYVALGRLGGYRPRKKGPPPGWLVLWRGWTKMQTMLDGARAIRRLDELTSPNSPRKCAKK